ncbi:hypothetical protein [Ammoniphilus sp. CFH 90114]|uniref:hypothetical protein n=1 Tax=Ammoniphilus sp. CFH 90114 TaxID=2493665 RepID=UPI00101008F3|nr:hypothetical protein [Ammoniphilus sp. CFH 90114]RXT07817.1 hypothetical protein EIZ39_10325 [Ammoniphilus sp. CFH 90114]
MNYIVLQPVTLRDFNNEIMAENHYLHGEYNLPYISPGVTFVTHALGLKGFEIVVDPRFEPQKHKVVDIEISLLDTSDAPIKVYLEPITLIIGQHDIGNA